MSGDDFGNNVYVHVKDFADLAGAKDVDSEGFNVGNDVAFRGLLPCKDPV